MSFLLFGIGFFGTAILPVATAQKIDLNAPLLRTDASQPDRSHAGHKHADGDSDHENELYDPTWGTIDPNDASDQANAYRSTFSQLKLETKKLRRLFVQHHTTIGKDLYSDIETWFDALKSSQQATLAFREAACKLYSTDPQKYLSVGHLLSAVLKTEAKSDRYEGLLDVARSLVEGGYPSKDFWGSAIATAMALNEYDLAEEWARQAFIKGFGENPISLATQYARARQRWQIEQSARMEDKQRDDNPRVLVTTNKGKFTIELFEREAPNTVANFLYLVEHQYYNRLTFFRVVPQFIAQSGCVNGDGSGSPGYSIRGEMGLPGARPFLRGSLAMALAIDPKTQQTLPDSAGSQFVISRFPNQRLDGAYTVFGRIIDGIEFLGNLAEVDFTDKEFKKTNPEAQADVILGMQILRKQDHPNVPETVEGKLPY